jgi:alpha-galactosidase
MFIQEILNLGFIQVQQLYEFSSSLLVFSLFNTLDAGFRTCGDCGPGSLGYETKDANTYANWTVDYLKYDNCASDGSPPEKRYPVMRDALNATGRPIFYSMCGIFFN